MYGNHPEKRKARHAGTLVQRQSAKKSHKSDDWMDFPFSVLFLDENNPEAYLNKQTKNEKDVANLRRHCKTTQNKTKKKSNKNKLIKTIVEE